MKFSNNIRIITRWCKKCGKNTSVQGGKWSQKTRIFLCKECAHA